MINAPCLNEAPYTLTKLDNGLSQVEWPRSLARILHKFNFNQF